MSSLSSQESGASTLASSGQDSAPSPSLSERPRAITKGNPAIRFRAHAHGGSSAKRDWFKSQPAPVMEIVSSIRGSQAMAVAAEVTLTRYYSERGHRMLNREACYV